VEASISLHYTQSPIDCLPEELLVLIIVLLGASMIEGILLVDYKTSYHILEYGDIVEAYNVLPPTQRTPAAPRLRWRLTALTATLRATTHCENS
jgi:hypothetical protein